MSVHLAATCAFAETVHLNDSGMNTIYCYGLQSQPRSDIGAKTTPAAARWGDFPKRNELASQEDLWITSESHGGFPMWASRGRKTRYLVEISARNLGQRDVFVPSNSSFVPRRHTDRSVKLTSEAFAESAISRVQGGLLAPPPPASLKG